MSDQSQHRAGHGDAEQLHYQASWQLGVLEARIEAHRKRARTWDVGAKVIAYVLTLTAGISALTIVTDHEAVAVTFAIVTAVFTAANTAFGPAETAKQHRAAASEYERAILRADDIASTCRPSTQFNQSTGMYEPGPSIAGDELSAVWQEYERLRLEVLDISNKSPLVDWESVYERNMKEEEAAWERARAQVASRTSEPTAYSA
jgi:hypothetical protein